MRVRILNRPPVQSIDGLQLDRFEPGHQYEVGNSLGALLLAEGWASPVSLEEPGLVIPFSETDPFTPKLQHDGPPNLIREHWPPYLEERASAPTLLPRRKLYL